MGGRKRGRKKGGGQTGESEGKRGKGRKGRVREDGERPLDCLIIMLQSPILGLIFFPLT